MQKKLLGVAVATALAAPGLVFAQSAVQVYGTVHMSASRIKFGSDTLGNPSQSKFDVNSHSSNWGLRSTETLGGGMTAWFQAEFNMPMLRENGTGNTAGTSRNSGVGLRGAFGNVYYGTWETPWAQTFRLWDVGTIGGYGPNTSIIGRRETTNVGRAYNCAGSLGVTADGGNVASPTAATVCNNAAAGAPALGGAGTGAGANLGYPLWRRYMQSIFYESPVFAGVQAKVAYLPNENKSDYGTSSATAPSNAIGTTVGINSNPSSWSGSLTWTGLGGRARAFAATMRSKEWSQLGQTDTGWTAGGGYDFGVANVGATYERYKYKSTIGDITAKEYAVGVAVPLGSGKIGFSYARAKELEGMPAGTPNDTKAKMWNLGYEWGLSKRTALGFGFVKLDNGANVAFTWSGHTTNPNGATSSTVNAGTDQTHVFVSIRHSF